MYIRFSHFHEKQTNKRTWHVCTWFRAYTQWIIDGNLSSTIILTVCLILSQISHSLFNALNIQIKLPDFGSSFGFVRIEDSDQSTNNDVYLMNKRCLIARLINPSVLPYSFSHMSILLCTANTYIFVHPFRFFDFCRIDR